MTPLRENQGQPGRETDVTTQAGVIYQRSSDPVSGTRQTVGTYSGVAVSDHPAGPSAPPVPPSTDKIQRRALPEGRTRTAVAGYLYFAKYSEVAKTDTVELHFSKDGVSVSLVFPK